MGAYGVESTLTSLESPQFLRLNEFIDRRSSVTYRSKGRARKIRDPNPTFRLHWNLYIMGVSYVSLFSSLMLTSILITSTCSKVTVYIEERGWREYIKRTTYHRPTRTAAAADDNDKKQLNGRTDSPPWSRTATIFGFFLLGRPRNSQSHIQLDVYNPPPDLSPSAGQQPPSQIPQSPRRRPVPPALMTNDTSS